VIALGFGRLDWSQWLYGIFAGFIGGGAGAVVSGVTVSAVDPADFNFSTGKFYVLVLTIFTANGLLNMFAFLHQNPLPAVRTVTTIEHTEKVQELQPNGVTVTTSDKKQVSEERK
jgi:hypothetical protein